MYLCTDVTGESIANMTKWESNIVVLVTCAQCFIGIIINSLD